MYLKQRKTSNQSGDTIVEVLLAIAVVSVVLGGAYASVSRSLNSARASQERNEAVKFVESQLESLEVALKDNAKKATIQATGTGDFCLTDTLEVKLATDAECKKGPDSRYKLSTKYDSGDKKFTSSARWDRVGGGEEQYVNIVYKAYP